MRAFEFIAPAASRQQVFKQALIEHLRDQRFTHALTLAWNRSKVLDAARDDLRALHRLVDQELLGSRFNRKPKDERTLAVFAFEGIGPGGHLHVHSLWRIPEKRHLLPFARLFQCKDEDKEKNEKKKVGVWKRIVPSGSYKLALVDDPVVYGGYMLKDQHPDSDADTLIWSQDFFRS